MFGMRDLSDEEKRVIEYKSSQLNNVYRVTYMGILPWLFLDTSLTCMNDRSQYWEPNIGYGIKSLLLSHLVEGNSYLAPR